jgi:hypothetical protein
MQCNSKSWPLKRKIPNSSLSCDCFYNHSVHFFSFPPPRATPFAVLSFRVHSQTGSLITLLLSLISYINSIFIDFLVYFSFTVLALLQPNFPFYYMNLIVLFESRLGENGEITKCFFTLCWSETCNCIHATLVAIFAIILFPSLWKMWKALAGYSFIHLKIIYVKIILDNFVDAFDWFNLFVFWPLNWCNFWIFNYITQWSAWICGGGYRDWKYWERVNSWWDRVCDISG